MEQHLTLYELNNLVHCVIADTMADEYWVVAEISELRVAATGHCYVELVEKDGARDTMRAKARGNIWRDVWPLLSACFEQATGQRLVAGIKVLVRASVTFHELYGYALNITDIDPSYTLGDVARHRREIIAKLTEEGVLELNKELPLPRPLRRIAVISSGTAAGYGDFCDQLEQSGYAFVTQLFPAAMQGRMVEKSVIAALDAIAAEQERWDAVAIIRGGGAVSDLSGFDTYLLAANVAQFPLPVLTGIGHERDDTVIDLVAHTRLKTPTAVAAFLVETRQREIESVDALSHRLKQAVADRLACERRRVTQVAARFQISSARYGAGQRELLSAMWRRVERCAEMRLQRANFEVGSLGLRLQHAVTARMEKEHLRLTRMAATVRMADPQRILNMGFSLTEKDGHVVRDARTLKTGDRIVTHLAHGAVTSEVLADTQNS